MVRKEENWKLMLFPQNRVAPKQLVGKAKYEDENEKLIVDILWDNEFVFEKRSTLLITSSENANFDTIIYLTDKYVKQLYEKEYAAAGLWHEIGHIHNGHFDLDIDQEYIRRERYQAIVSNRVFFQEEEADIFATKAVGKNRMIKFLQFSKTNRISIGDGNSELAIKEFDLRINQIKRMKI